MNPEEFNRLVGIVQGLIVASTIVLVAYSPIARALGNRILHGKLPHPGAGFEEARVDQLSGEMAALRQQLEEAQERLDFTERVIAQSRDKPQLGAGRDD